ncbi:hypothetical protein [Kaistia algarum]|nr:hypothetical protein [Kaistia algarum]MCX5513619.1 hypothetical protein [Kaistia algarum]
MPAGPLLFPKGQASNILDFMQETDISALAADLHALGEQLAEQGVEV